jgi:phage terminase Nu1 subunit (DNA packaging protein)
MKPSVECRRMAEWLREKANEIDDADLKAEYAYLVRGYLRLARQFEQDMDREQTTTSKGSNGDLNKDQ